VYLNDLASVLRASGLNVIEVGGWQGHNHGSMAGVRSIVCHHTAGAATGNFPSLNVVRNGRTGLAGPLAQLGLARNGDVYVISNGVAWHAGATIDDSVYGNQWSIGIEAENTGTGQAWPEPQVDAYAKLCAALCKHYKIPVDRVKGHKEICRPAGRKIDPANLPGDMAGLRARVAGYIASPGGGIQPPATTSRLELMERYNVEKSASTTTKRVRLPGGPNAKIIIRPAVEGGAEAPVWLGHVYAWGSDKQGVGGDPMSIPGYNGKVVYSREIALPNAIWADVQYSTNADFVIDCVG
jgi:hypothetical protein